MKKICLVILSLLVTFNLFSTLAASLSLNAIGNLNTEGKTYSEWWYTGTSPTLKGTAEAGETVTVSVDGEESEVTADDSGDWTYFHEGFSEGDYEVSLSSGDDSYSFTLHLGQSVPTDLGDTSETSPSTVSGVPETGIGQVFALVGGVSALALGWYLYTEKRNSLVID